MEEKARKEGKPLPEKKQEEKKADGENDEDKGQVPNSSNGGNTEKYNWG